MVRILLAFLALLAGLSLKIYLVSNTIGLDDPRVTNILVGPDKCWTDTMLKCLPRMREKHLLIWGEDLFLCRRVNTRRVVEICRWVTGVDANYMRLNAVPRPDKRCTRLAGVPQKALCIGRALR